MAGLQNLFMYSDHKGIMRLAVGDFGLATWDRVGDAAAHSRYISGTPGWMSPETQTRGPDGQGRITDRKDIWCVGMLFAYMLHGMWNITWEDALKPGDSTTDKNGVHIECFTCALAANEILMLMNDSDAATRVAECTL